MDPASSIGISAFAIQVAGLVLTSIQKLEALRQRFKQADTTVRLLVERLKSLRYSLKCIANWSSPKRGASPCSRELKDALSVCLHGCTTQVDYLSNFIGGFFTANAPMRFADKARFIWKSDTMKEYLNNLDFEIKALDLMLNSYQWCVP